MRRVVLQLQAKEDLKNKEKKWVESKYKRTNRKNSQEKQEKEQNKGEST